MEFQPFNIVNIESVENIFLLVVMNCLIDEILHSSPSFFFQIIVSSIDSSFFRPLTVIMSLNNGNNIKCFSPDEFKNGTVSCCSI